MPSHRDDQGVKDLGRKVRGRLDEENQKRREIVRLETADATNPQEKRKGGGIAISAAKKRRRPAAVRKRSSRSSTANRWNENNIDTRTPLVEYLGDAIDNKKTWSDVVRLHGLPVGTTRGDIGRFFSGLDLQEVFLLPSNDTHVEGWDAEEMAPGRVILERHPFSFRVYVRFARSPVAALAAQRSGEVLHLGTNNQGERRGATIAITQVYKRLAKYLHQNMAILVNTNDPLHRILAECEENWLKMVPSILWTAAVRALDITPTTKDLLYAPFRDFDKAPQLDPSTSAGQSTLVEIRNNLRNDFLKLRLDPYALVAMKIGCPDALSTPFLRLTKTASNLLQERVTNVERYLHMVRTVQRTQLLRRSAGSVLDGLLARHEAVGTVKAKESKPERDKTGEQEPRATSGTEGPKMKSLKQGQSQAEGSEFELDFESESDESSASKERNGATTPPPPKVLNDKKRAAAAPNLEKLSGVGQLAAESLDNDKNFIPAVPGTKDKKTCQARPPADKEDAFFTLESDSDSDESSVHKDNNRADTMGQLAAESLDNDKNFLPAGPKTKDKKTCQARPTADEEDAFFTLESDSDSDESSARKDNNRAETTGQLAGESLDNNNNFVPAVPGTKDKKTGQARPLADEEDAFFTLESDSDASSARKDNNRMETTPQTKVLKGKNRAVESPNVKKTPGVGKSVAESLDDNENFILAVPGTEDIETSQPKARAEEADAFFTLESDSDESSVCKENRWVEILSPATVLNQKKRAVESPNVEKLSGVGHSAAESLHDNDNIILTVPGTEDKKPSQPKAPAEEDAFFTLESDSDESSACKDNANSTPPVRVPTDKNKATESTNLEKICGARGSAAKSLDDDKCYIPSIPGTEDKKPSRPKAPAEEEDAFFTLESDSDESSACKDNTNTTRPVRVPRDKNKAIESTNLGEICGAGRSVAKSLDDDKSCIPSIPGSEDKKPSLANVPAEEDDAFFTIESDSDESSA